MGLFGVEVWGRPPFDVLRRVGHLLGGMDLDPVLTAWEDLRLVAAVSGVKTSGGELRAVLEVVGALEYAKRLYGKLSAGQKKRVLLAAALLGRPELLILDSTWLPAWRSWIWLRGWRLAESLCFSPLMQLTSP